MTISYKWLSEYLPNGPAGIPVTLDPDRLSRILTSIGLEVESMSKYESVKGGLKGLVIGEVLSTEKHPNADKLTLTKVTIGNGEPLQIVCGAPNVATGQKVVVATVGTTIYPANGDPLTMKVAKIRSVESHGMICAEDEIGIGDVAEVSESKAQNRQFIVKDWYGKDGYSIDLKRIFGDFYWINLRNARVFFCAEDVRKFTVDLIQDLPPGKNRNVHLLRKIEGSNIIQPSGMILMFVSEKDRIQTLDPSPKHLYSEIWSSIYH